MLREEGFRKRGEILDGLVLGVRPPRGELERVRGFLHALRTRLLAEVLATRRVGVVLRERAVGDDEQLHVFKQPRAGPKAVALVAVDLVERLADVDAATLELDVHHR